MPKKKSMSIEACLNVIEKGVYKKAIQDCRAACKETGKRNKTDLVCFVGISPTRSFQIFSND